MRTEIERRLSALEAHLVGDEVFVLAETFDGEEKEMPIKEWYRNRREMKFLKFTRGFDPSYHDVKLLLRAFDEAAEEAANEHDEEQIAED